MKVSQWYRYPNETMYPNEIEFRFQFSSQCGCHIVILNIPLQTTQFVTFSMGSRVSQWYTHLIGTPIPPRVSHWYTCPNGNQDRQAGLATKLEQTFFLKTLDLLPCRLV